MTPRPKSFQVDVPYWGWITFREGETDIPSILDKIWADAHAKDMSIRVLCEGAWEIEEGEP